MRVPDGYEVRPATLEDIDDIVGMVRSCQLKDVGEALAQRAWFTDRWRRPRFDPGNDTWLLGDAEGRVAAFAWTWDESDGTSFDSSGWVEPGHRRRGLG